MHITAQALPASCVLPPCIPRAADIACDGRACRLYSAKLRWTEHMDVLQDKHRHGSYEACSWVLAAQDCAQY